MTHPQLLQIRDPQRIYQENDIVMKELQTKRIYQDNTKWVQEGTPHQVAVSTYINTAINDNSSYQNIPIGPKHFLQIQDHQ